MTPFIPPGATLGVMGGGQLGRMFVHAAQQMGYFVVVLDADPASPAGLVAQYHIKAGYLDEQGLAQLMQRSAAITTEFENVPAEALMTLGAQRLVAPGAEAVAVCQDRAAEKQHFARCDVPCAPHAVIDSAAGLDSVPDHLLPGILKTTRLGYDGKGQVRVATRADLAAAWQALGGVSTVLEKLLPLAFEVSVIVARSAAGQMVHFPLQQNLHRDGILAVTQVPAPDLTPAVQQRAIDAAERVAESLGYVGVLCVEFFVLQDGSVVANEMAPRPHNSGHYTIDACDLSQFDLQVRTMTGAPLAEPRLHSPAVMLNLLGDLWFASGADAQDDRVREPDWARVLALPGVHLHLYGKATPRRARKMGHLTLTAASAAEVRSVALQAAAILGLAAF
ncbi:MAG: 5-(carboxyamino)imidazole ribonucleotide synthase [Rhizobacter sp.]|nr:5-(carboxyamino)imidazole ribonucleotide synthase [Rhizobacter sp.]MBP6268407.1 5-(carboxyamino)imidazole ribonucleotide synthase [Rhizobacter sp.]